MSICKQIFEHIFVPNEGYCLYIFTRIRRNAKTRLNYVANMVLDTKDSPYL